MVIDMNKLLTIMIGAILLMVCLSFQGATAEQTEIRSTGDPVAAWHFDGDVNDSSGNGNHGVVHGDPVYVDGISGQALEFDGVDDYVEVPTSDSLNMTEMLTIEAWYYRIGNSSGLYGNLVGKYDGYGGYMLKQVETTGKIGFWIRKDDVHFKSIFSDVTLSDIQDSWTHIVAVYDGDNISLWINGIEQTHKETGAILSKTSSPLLIGKYNHYTNGIIDDVAIYGRALTEEEIMFNYARTIPSVKNITYQNDTYQNTTYQNITYENHTHIINETTEYYNSTNLTQIIDNATYINTTVQEHYYNDVTYRNLTYSNVTYRNVTYVNGSNKDSLNKKEGSIDYLMLMVLGAVVVVVIFSIYFLEIRPKQKNKPKKVKTDWDCIESRVQTEIEHVPNGKDGKEEMKRLLSIKHNYSLPK